MKFSKKLVFAAMCALSLSVFSSEQATAVPPQHFGPPLLDHAYTNRAFQGISSIAVTKGGRLWATWYAGKAGGEGLYNYVVLSTSGDNGASWKEVRIVDPDGDGPLRCYDPEIWIDPLDRMWLIWAQSISTVKGPQTWAAITENPEATEPQWSEPRILAPGVMMCKPIVLRDGAWVFPIADWEARYQKLPNAPTSGCWVSENQGASFTYRGGVLVPIKNRSFDEHMFVERRDGSLWALIRAHFGTIGESFSSDGGRTWSVAAPSAIAHTSSRFFISRLQSGNLLLVKHGPMNQRTGRSHLMAFVSRDDGKSWRGGLMLDERAGVSYPDGQQAADGTIYVTYDYKRKEDRKIYFASFMEEDAEAGKATSGKVRLEMLISQGSGGAAPKAVVKINKDTTQLDNSDGVELDVSAPGTWKGSVKCDFKLGIKLFADRAHAVAELPKGLEKAKIVKVTMDGSKTLTCEKSGMLYVLTPLPERNSSNVTAQLLRSGFQKVALPEVRLFGPNHTGNYCTLYQKQCSAGETVTLGKWFVPVCF